MLEAQRRALEIRNRLRNPENGNQSSEIAVLPTALWGRQKNVMRQEIERQTAEADARRQSAVADAIKASQAADKLFTALADRAQAVSIARKLVEDEGARPPSMTAIFKAVCDHYRVTLVDLCANRRTKEIVLPRQVAMYLCKKLTLNSLPQIGARLGGRDHTTVLHGIRKIEWMVDNDPDFTDLVPIKQALGV